MAWQLVNNAIVEMQIVGDYKGNVTRTIRHYRAIIVGSPVDGGAAMEEFLDACETQEDMFSLYRAAVAQDWLMVGQYAQAIAPTRWRRYFKPIVTGPGLRATPALTASTAGFIELRGDIADRHSVGGVHMPCPSTADYVDGKFEPDQVDRYNTLADAFMATINTAAPAVEFRPVVFNRVVPANSVVVTGQQVQTSVRTMRRRVLGRGE